MPLVICRACKSYAGKAINYITDKKKAERITTYGLDESRSLAQQFIDTGMIHGKGDTYDERKYYHIKISFEPKDRIENGGKLTAELAERIADEYFKSQYGSHEYILATHTDKEHIHCHAIINAVSFESGKKIQHSNKDLADMKDAVNDVSERYGVSRFDWKEAVREKRQRAKEERASKSKELTQREKYIKEREGEEWASSSWKETLRSKIDEAKGQCRSRAEFQKYLFENYGVEMPRNTEKTVSFKHPAVAETVRGVKLGAEYTAESIDQALKENQERIEKKDAKLRFTEKRNDRDTHRGKAVGNIAGADNASNVRHIITANEPVGSGADESGERGAKTNTGELRAKLQQIRGLDEEFDPAAQRRATESDKRAAEEERAEQRRAIETAERAAQQAREEAERIKDEQRRSEREHNKDDYEYER